MGIYNLEQLKNEWLLFDSDILIKMYKHANEPEFGSFIKLLKQLNVVPLITREVVYELTCSSGSRKELEANKKFLEDLAVTVLPNDLNMVDSAIKISNIYQNKKPKNCAAGMIDCLSSAYLQKYGDKLTMITSNLKDFPETLHDRIGVHPIDVKTEVIVAGFIKFNQKKFQDCTDDFNKAS